MEDKGVWGSGVYVYKYICNYFYVGVSHEVTLNFSMASFSLMGQLNDQIINLGNNAIVFFLNYKLTK